MQIAILEDNESELKDLLEVLKGVNHPIDTIECYDSGEKLLARIELKGDFDLVFFDIYINDTNGIDIAKKLLECSPSTEIIFTTSSLEHAIKAFELNALHYLVKPVTKTMIEDAFLRYQAKVSKKRAQLTVKVGRNQRTIFLDEIMYLQSNDHKISINLLGGKSISVYSKISDMEKRLDESFLKIQRGVIVNMAFIEMMGSKECVLQNGESILLSRKDRGMIKQVYENYIFNCLEKNSDFN